MSKELNCTNCSIGDFKAELCDCDNGFCKEFKSIGTQEDFFNVVMQRIRPQGEWVLVEPRYPIEQKVYWNKEQALADTKGNGAIEKRKCSCCGFTKNFMGHMKDEKFKLWNFCPNCGARMKG